MQNQPAIHQVQINGLTQAFQDEGQGEPLVLLHGSLCDLRYWHWQISELSKQFRVIAPSLRHYWPIKHPEQSSFSAEVHAADVFELLSYLQIDKSHILGHSRGAAVAVRMAQTQPERISSLILADPGLRDLHELQDSIDFKKKAFALIQQGDIESGMQLFIDAVSGAGTWKKMLRWFKQMTIDNANTLSLQQFEEPVLFDHKGFSALQNVPVSLIGGSDSPYPFPEIIDDLTKFWTHAKKHILSPASHGMNLALPHAFNHCVIEHLQTYASS